MRLKHFCNAPIENSSLKQVWILTKNKGFWVVKEISSCKFGFTKARALK